MKKLFDMFPKILNRIGYIGIGIAIALLCEKLYLNYTFIVMVLSSALVVLSHIAEHQIAVSDYEEESN